MSNTNVNINYGKEDSRNMINYQHQQSEGYRQHSNMRRDVLSWEALHTLAGKNKLTTSFFLWGSFLSNSGSTYLTRIQFESPVSTTSCWIGEGCSSGTGFN